MPRGGSYPNNPVGTGGGGGLTLGPAPNSFTGSDRAAAIAARDNTTSGITGALLARYDAQPTFTIILTYGTTTVYQSRRGSAWVDVTGLVRGPEGPMGDQARFLVYAYLNTATAPTTAPTGGTFTQSTGVLTVPAGYQAIPSTPPTGQRTYRIEAAINPATDINAVVLAWSVPAELPAYAVARLAITAAEEAVAARDQAEIFSRGVQDVAVGSPKGDIWATSPVLGTATRAANSEYPFPSGEGWDVTTEGLAAGISDPGNGEENLPLPNLAPAGTNGYWFQALVEDVVVGEVYYPFGQRLGSRTFPTLARIYAGQDSSDDAQFLQADYRSEEVSIYGGGTTLSANTRVRIRAAVVRGSGGIGGGGLTQAQVQSLINATPLSSLQGQVTDAQIPAAIMRDAELTASAIRTLLGLTATEVNDLFTGATISGQVITYTQNDGTTVALTIPSGMGGMADGVVSSGAFNAAGTELVLTLNTGGTVTVNVPAVLRGSGGLTESQVDARIAPYARIAPTGTIADAQIPDAIMRDAELTAAAVRTTLGLTAAETLALLAGNPTISGRVIRFTRNDGTTTTVTIPEGVTETRVNALISAAGHASQSALTALTARVAQNETDIAANDTELADHEARITALEGGDTPTPMGLRSAISLDTDLTADEVTAGTTSDDAEITVPTWAGGNRYIFIGVPDAEDDITAIRTAGLNVISSWQRVAGMLDGFKYWRTTDAQNMFVSGATYEIEQG